MKFKSLVLGAWRRLDLVADDPGIEQDWAVPAERRRSVVQESRPAPSAQRKASIARSPMTRGE